MTLIRAFVWNLRPWSVMLREKAQAAKTARLKVPMHRSGSDCSIVVMKRGNARGAKGVGHRHCFGSTGNGRNPMFNGRRQPSRDGTSRMTRECQVRIWCSEASCHSSGWKSRQQRSPVAVVVISSNGEGNRSVGSLEVKAPEGRAYRSDPYRGASNLAGRSKCVNREAPKYLPRVKRIAGRIGSAELFRSRRRRYRHRSLD